DLTKAMLFCRETAPRRRSMQSGGADCCPSMQQLPLAVVVLTADSEGVLLVPIRLFPPVVIGVIDLRFEILVGIDDPTSFWPLVLRDIHRIELFEIRCFESQRRRWHRRVGLVYRDIHLRLNR